MLITGRNLWINGNIYEDILYILSLRMLMGFATGTYCSSMKLAFGRTKLLFTCIHTTKSIIPPRFCCPKLQTGEFFSQAWLWLYRTLLEEGCIDHSVLEDKRITRTWPWCAEQSHSCLQDFHSLSSTLHVREPQRHTRMCQIPQPLILKAVLSSSCAHPLYLQKIDRCTRTRCNCLSVVQNISVTNLLLSWLSW